MRPASIVRFERAYLGSVAVWLANMAVGWPVMLRQLEAQPQFNGNPQVMKLAETLLMGGVAAILVLWLLLWYFTARRASVVTKWIIVGFTVLGALRLPLVLAGAPAAGWFATVLSVAAFGLAAYATWLLFRPDAQAWFAGEGAQSDAAPIE